MGGGVGQAVHHNPRLLHPGQEQSLRDNPVNRARREQLPSWRHDIPSLIEADRGWKQRITPVQWSQSECQIGLDPRLDFLHGPM